MKKRQNRSTNSVLLTISVRISTISPLLARGIAELQVDVPVLASLGPVLAVGSSLVGFVVDLSAKGVSELLCTAAALLAKVMALPEMLHEVLIIAVERN